MSTYEDLSRGVHFSSCVLPRRKLGQRRQQYLSLDISKTAGKHRIFIEETIRQARELLIQLTGTASTVSYTEDPMLEVPTTSASSSM